MGKEQCFCIENNILYLEQVLVDYMDIPIFFLCKDQSQYYVVLCTDIDALNYIIVKVALGEVYGLLHGKIPMRNVILEQKEYWEVISGEEISQDTVIRHGIASLDTAVLPEKEACFKILTDEMRIFVQKFDNDFLASENFSKTQKIIQEDDRWMIDETMEEFRIERFIVMEDYTFKIKLRHGCASTVNYEEKYGTDRKKATVLCKLQASEEWENEDTNNAAA